MQKGDFEVVKLGKVESWMQFDYMVMGQIEFDEIDAFF